ncbi:MAG: hypothetical protein KQH79_07255 [Bacteroidetes bacterium]|nr:hypothetical protein [Bacteroidota bacterium]
MKKTSIQSAINILIFIWIAVWLYYALFNWDVFVVKLNTNLGFNTVPTLPFVLFFFIGLLILVVMKYIIYYDQVQVDARDKEYKDKISLLKKDIEILKLKEVLFKMQSEGMNKSTATVNALQAKLDELSKKRDENNDDEKEEKEE